MDDLLATLTPADVGATLARRLREARRARGWTQADLAEAVGVSRKTINTIERGVFAPSEVLALRIARAFDAAVEDVFALVDDP